MRLLHLSDLHFGTQIPTLLKDLKNQINTIKADLVIVSGDFTQVGSEAEFLQAHDFLKSLGIPYFCVPGNHDIPRYDLVKRFTNPFHLYRQYIDKNLSPDLRMDKVSIVGINTARPILPHWNWANGAVSNAQLKHLQDIFSKNPGYMKVCVMHHPVHIAEGNVLKTVVFGGEKALRAIKSMKIDLVLTGHVHHASITTMEEDKHKTIFLSASTALSHRLRQQSNGYNLVTLDERGIVIEIFSYADGIFHKQQTLEYNKNPV